MTFFRKKGAEKFYQIASRNGSFEISYFCLSHVLYVPHIVPQRQSPYFLTKTKLLSFFKCTYLKVFNDRIVSIRKISDVLSKEK